MTLFIDIDGTVADTIPAAIERANKGLSNRDRIRIEDITDHEIARCEGLSAGQKAALQRVLNGACGDLYPYVPPVPGAQAGVKALREMGHRIVFVTAGHPDLVGDKADWLVRHGFLVPDKWNYDPANTALVWCCDKGLLKGDALIDDSPAQLRRFKDANFFNEYASALCIPQPWNATPPELPEGCPAWKAPYCRVTCWAEVVAYFREDAEPGDQTQYEEMAYERSVEAWSREE